MKISLFCIIYCLNGKNRNSVHDHKSISFIT